MRNKEERTVKTVKDFIDVYFPRLATEEPDSKLANDLSYVKEPVSKSLDRNKR